MAVFNLHGRNPIRRRSMLGAAIAEYLPLLSLVLVILVGGAVQYVEQVRKHAAQMSDKYACQGGGRYFNKIVAALVVLYWSCFWGGCTKKILIVTLIKINPASYVLVA